MAKTFEHSFWGLDFCSAAGSEALKKRLREGRATCKTCADYLAKRAKAEEEFSKHLSNSSKQIQKLVEIGSLRLSVETVKDETENMAQFHLELSNQFNAHSKRIDDFVTRQRTDSKQREDTLEKAFKTKTALFKTVSDAKKSYDSKSSESEQAELILSKAKENKGSYATKDWEKMVNRSTSTKSDAEKAYRNYEESVRKLEAARQDWEHEMVEYCKLCKKLEMERIQFLQNELWISANLTSQAAVNDDKESEVIRQKLQSVNIHDDIQSFIASATTGSERPPPVRLELYKSQLTDDGPSSNGMTMQQRTSQDQPPLNFINRTFFR
jgi:hypothetical protein